MQVYIPENLKLFTTSHWINGKCQVGLEAITGIVMSHEERTKTRVYGDNTGVGSSTSIDQAFWIQFEDGREQCIQLKGIDIHLARPGHQVTFIKATNQLDKKNYSLYAALYNHVTDEYCIYQQRQAFTSEWIFILYKMNKKKKQFGFLKLLIFSIVGALIWQFILIPLAELYFGFLLSIIFFGFWGYAIIFLLLKKTDHRFKDFENHIRKIMNDFRQQMKRS